MKDMWTIGLLPEPLDYGWDRLATVSEYLDTRVISEGDQMSYRARLHAFVGDLVEQSQQHLGCSHVLRRPVHVLPYIWTGTLRPAYLWQDDANGNTFVAFRAKTLHTMRPIDVAHVDMAAIAAAQG